MKTISVGTLQSFMRSVREAQELSQKNIAQKIQVWPSALTQYEKSDASLSKEKLLMIAPLLNLNPVFIEHGVGNPFKAADSSKIIKMSLMLRKADKHKIDLTLIKFIADYNDKLTFIFLKPIEVPKDKPRLVSRWQRSGNTTYALLIQDDDENRFLFKRKDDAFFNENEIVSLLRDNSMGYHKYHKVSVMGISLALFDKIRNWVSIKRSDFDSLIATAQCRDKVEMLSELIDLLSIHETKDDEKRALERLRAIVQNIEPQNASDLLDSILPQFVRILSNTVHT